MEGGIIKTLDLETDGGLNSNCLKKLINDRTKMIIICSPHNPTGTITSENDIKKLLSLIEGRNISILSDEIYERIDFYGKHNAILAVAKKIWVQ